MVISSGTAKSAGLYVMDTLNISEFWMPALIGGVALPLLALLGYALNRLPQPTAEDIAIKSKRETLNGKQRWELFKNFMPFLTLLFIANVVLTILRDIKEDFLVKIIDVSQYSSWMFAQVDSVVTLIILIIFGLMVFVRSNLKALSILLGLIIASMVVMAVVWLRTIAAERHRLAIHPEPVSLSGFSHFPDYLLRPFYRLLQNSR
jgi:zinc transporter ZupT